MRLLCLVVPIWSSIFSSAQLFFSSSCLFVSPNYHRGLSHRVPHIFLWFIPKGTHTSHTHCMSEIIQRKSGWVEGKNNSSAEERKCVLIIKYLKTTTTTFGWEIIGCSIEVGVSPDTVFQWLQSIITTWRYMESNKETLWNGPIMAAYRF